MISLELFLKEFQNPKKKWQNTFCCKSIYVRVLNMSILCNSVALRNSIGNQKFAYLGFNRVTYWCNVYIQK